MYGGNDISCVYANLFTWGDIRIWKRVAKSFKNLQSYPCDNFLLKSNSF